MAFAKPYNEDLPAEIAAQPRQTSVGQGAAGGVSAGPVQFAQTTSPVPFSTAAPSPSSSGGFVNLNQYLDANRQQATQLGERVAGKIGTETQQAQEAIKNAQNQFGQAVQQGTATYDQDLFNKIVGDPTKYTGSVVPETQQQELARWIRMREGKYAGPQTLQQSDFYQPAQKETLEAQQAGQLGETTGGRIELLRQLSQTPYARGGLSLDQLLVQNTEPAAQKVSEAVAATKPIEETLKAASTSAEEQARKAAEASAKTAQQVKEGVVGKLTEAEKAAQANVGSLQQRLAQEEQDRINYLNALSSGQPPTQDVGTAPNRVVPSNPNSAKAALLAGKTPQETPTTDTGRATIQIGGATAPTTGPAVNIPGLTAEQQKTLTDLLTKAKSVGGTGVNLGDYYRRADVGTVGLQNALSPEQAARYNALAQLGGVQGNLAVNPNEVGQAVKGGEFDFNQAVANLQGQIQSGEAKQQQQQANQAIIAQQQQAAAQQKAAMDKQLKSQEKMTIGTGAATGAMIGASVGGPVGAVVGAVIGGLVGLFSCFTAGTPILMADGSYKKVEDLKIGDVTALGGAVYGKGEVLSNDLYFYRGAVASGTHTVFCEDGVWRHLEDVPEAERVYVDGFACVYPIITENNLLVTGDFISADYLEIPEFVDNMTDMTQTQRLEWLNNNTERNEWLLNTLHAAFPAKKEKYEAQRIQVGTRLSDTDEVVDTRV